MLGWILTSFAQPLAEDVGADGDLVSDADLPHGWAGQGDGLHGLGLPRGAGPSGGGRQAVRRQQLVNVHPERWRLVLRKGFGNTHFLGGFLTPNDFYTQILNSY